MSSEALKTTLKITKRGRVFISPAGVGLEKDDAGEYGFFLPLRRNGAGGKILSELDGFSVPVTDPIEVDTVYPLHDSSQDKRVALLRFTSPRMMRDALNVRRIPLSVSNSGEIEHSDLKLVLERYPETATTGVFTSGRLMVVYNVVPEFLQVACISKRQVASRLKRQFIDIINQNNF